ncbi:AraC family transcriptional regulator [Pedobacter sp. HMF7647]|uniref:AraC family transcriptional regulator n=1 Tax=Hufsiella arboris TaxID=2695275 RepID=A0A7K1YCJ0_9SPHI|nr:AraC family transcriptional regulator [Hufsiella arboris]MXV52294.1 AraC family transcriptional regulator [Hufsiella arboris]
MNNIATTDKKLKEGFVGQKMIVLPPDIKKGILKNDLIKNFHLTAIGYYPHASYHDRERKAGCSEYILLYCTNGSGSIKIRDAIYTLTPNTFYILPKNSYHHYKSSKEDPWSIYWLHFTGELADSLYQRYIETGNSFMALPYEEKRIEAFDAIFELLENSFDLRNVEIANIKLLDFISSFIYFKEINPTIQDDDLIKKSIVFMKKNLDSRFSVDHFASSQHLSVSHYSRLFRAKTGSSPNQYFSLLKIQKSCQYLYFSDLSIKEICARLGFDDPYYFSRLFKKLMGTSPAKYRSKHKKN